MCTISIDVDEKVLRQANPNLDNIVAIRQWAQRLVDLSTKEMLGEDFSCTISPDILHSVEARQALAACDGVVLIEELNKSKYPAVGEEAKLIRSMNKEIVGGVLA